MPSVDDILNGIIRSEGGFTDDEDDTAHQKRRQKGDKWDSYCTNMGVTQYTLSDWLGRQATTDEVRTLDVDTVKEIYEKRYYTDPRIHTLPPSIQPVIFDSSVLYGQKTAIKFLQKVLNLSGFGTVDVDGVIGPQVRNAAAKANTEMGGFLVNALVEMRIHRAEEIVENDPAQAKYLKGWTNRANTFRVQV